MIRFAGKIVIARKYGVSPSYHCIVNYNVDEHFNGVRMYKHCLLPTIILESRRLWNLYLLMIHTIRGIY